MSKRAVPMGWQSGFARHVEEREESEADMAGWWRRQVEQNRARLFYHGKKSRQFMWTCVGCFVVSQAPFLPGWLRVPAFLVSIAFGAVAVFHWNEARTAELIADVPPGD